MARNVIESDFRSSKMAAGSHFVKKSCVLIWNDEKCDQKWFSLIQNGRWQPFCEEKKVVYWSEMTRNAIKSDFRSSKMAAGSHFVTKKKSKLLIDMKWWEMRSKVIFGHPKWPPAAILWTNQKKKSWVLIWNGEKCDQNSFSVIQNRGGGVWGASQWPVCKPFGDIHSICPWANNTPILVWDCISLTFV